MKKRLLLLVLTVLGGAPMQAGSWFESFRNYSPYQWGSFKRYAPENVASRLATMRYLYGDSVDQNQEQLVNSYQTYLKKKLINKKAPYNALVKEQNKIADAIAYAKNSPSITRRNDLINDLTKDHDYVQKRLFKREGQLNRLNELTEQLLPTIQSTKNKLLRPGSYHQYQHPDQYILNY